MTGGKVTGRETCWPLPFTLHSRSPTYIAAVVSPGKEILSGGFVNDFMAPRSSAVHSISGLLMIVSTTFGIGFITSAGCAEVARRDSAAGFFRVLAICVLTVPPRTDREYMHR